MFTAIAIVLGFYSFQITENIKVGFAFLANELTALFFGPFVGGIMGGIADILKFIVKPTGPFFPGFTFNAVLGAVIFGLIVYKKPLSLRRIIVAKVVVTIVCDLFLTTTWLNILYGNPWIPVFLQRIGKEIIMVPIEITLFWVVAKSLQQALRHSSLSLSEVK